MTDILTPTPVEEVIADLNQRIQQMYNDMYQDIDREEERLRQYRHDRHRRFQDETRHMAAQRDAMVSALAASKSMKPVILANN